ncbi:MAG: DNRLRE domain-containing protein [Phycisphaerae bacterium]|nr:DNRLRE domain-containing protein [Phycisphaerae bacterium]
MKKLKITLSFALVLLLCAAAQSLAATVNLAPTDDAYVHSGNPNNNYGFSSALYVGDENNNDPAIMTKSYLKFPLSSVLGAKINSAKLVLHINQMGNPASMQVDAHFVSNDGWSESTVTWNTAPAYNPTVSDSQVVSNGAQKVWKWDVTSEVITELNGDKVITVMIRDPFEIVRGQFAGFVSKDALHPSTDFPSLEIEYDDTIKWSQPPVFNPESQYPDCFWGWDEVSTYGPSTSSNLWFPAWACATQCHGDADCDGDVDGNDQSILTAAMGTTYPNIGYDPRADFDRDGDVDANDQAILTSYWQTNPPADCATSPQHIVADDWLCIDPRPVTDVHWWGSYEGYTDNVPPAGPDSFHIGIWTDVPAGEDQQWSHPGQMIHEWNVPRADANEVYVGCDYYPEYMTEPDACFHYDFQIPESEWFYQEDPNTIYWISIAAIYPDGTTTEFPWGWKTRPHYFNDDAVRIFMPTDPVIGSVFEEGEPIEDETGISWDMAFELTTIKEEPEERLKFQQLPLNGAIVEETQYWGHDELSTAYSMYDDTGQPLNAYEGCYMADDFADLEHSPVIKVKWWGSYLENEIMDPGVNRFLIAFEKDVAADEPGNPVTYSHPGDVILTQFVHLSSTVPLNPGEYSETWISYGGAPCNENLYEYEAVLKNPFPQDPNTVYWLKIVAMVDVDAAIWGQIQNILAANPGMTLCEFLNLPYSQQSEQYGLQQPITRWGWHNRDYTRMDPYASTPPAVQPGEHLAGTLPDGTADGTPIWHFQDDAVSGPVQINEAAGEMPFVDQPDWKDENYKYIWPLCPDAQQGVDGPGPEGEGIELYSKDLAFELWTSTNCRDKLSAVEKSDYDAYVAAGADPSCWCWQYQCHGDADGVAYGPGWIVYNNDLDALINAWKHKIGDANQDPCADFDHAAYGPGWRVYDNDLNILINSWKAMYPSLPDCPSY